MDSDCRIDLRSTADQVAVAQDNLRLANQNLDQARDRFSAGVTDNIEVSLARAMGTTRQRVKTFIEVK
jgi:outer membrane protein TolC